MIVSASAVTGKNGGRGGAALLGYLKLYLMMINGSNYSKERKMVLRDWKF